MLRLGSRNQELVQERKQNFKFDWDSKVVEILVAGVRSEQK